MPATYDTIASTSIASATSTVTFNSLGSYTDLIIQGSWRFDTLGDDIYLRFNNDSSTNYYYQQSVGEGANAVANDSSSGYTAMRIVNNALSTEDFAFEINIGNYRTTSHNKPALSRWAGNNSMGHFYGFWNSTAAITSIEIRKMSGNFAAGTDFKVIGVLKA
jgi:hypothetical protein